MAASPYPPLPLPTGITESYIETDDLTYHILEAGYDSNRKKPLILLLHGFPELAFSWRKIMPALAAGGFHVVAYDQRGYGRTSGWDTRPFAEVDLGSFALTRLVTDAVRLVYALGYRQVECVVGHDFGAVVSSLSGLTRPDIFMRYERDCLRLANPCLSIQCHIHVSPIHGISEVSIQHCPKLISTQNK